jgi:serine/threonine-protein kinase
VQQRQLTITDGASPGRPLGVPDGFSWPRFSPDGRQIAVSLGTLTRRDVWTYTLPAGPWTRVTTTGTLNDRPEWTPDGTAILFRSNRRTPNALWVQPVDVGAGARELFGLPDAQVDEGVLSRDGRYLLIQRDRNGNGEVWYRAMQGDTTPRPIDGGFGARFSPDGKWIAYTAGGAGTSTVQVYVRPFPAGADRFQVSLDGGTTPVWSADARRIYYANGGQLLVATIGSLQPFRIASRSVVLAKGFTFDGVHADYDVAPDGRTLVALQSTAQDASLVVVRNYDEEVRNRTERAASGGP